VWGWTLGREHRVDAHASAEEQAKSETQVLNDINLGLERMYL